MMRLRRRSERGTIAIMTAGAITMMLILGALGVDLGNAMNRKKQTQTSADFAALAGAEGLPTTDATTTQLVADWLNRNQPISDGTENCNLDAGQPITTTLLSDGKSYNGEVSYPDSNHVKVLAPAARVQYGFANVIGVKNGCVQGTATARIASSALGMMPYYVTSQCGGGAQVIKSDAGGPSIPFTVPTLFADGEQNSAILSGTDPNPDPTIITLQVAPGPDGPSITITGTNLEAANIDRVGFFNSDQTAPITAVPTSQGSTSITVNVPNAVASYQDVWWIRVHAISPSAWSTRSEARALQVGDAVLSCDPDPSSGNFGSINFPWGGNDLEDLTKSIQYGPQPPETLKPWSGSLPADNTCNAMAGVGVISEEGHLRENTNCVQSVTGLKANPAYDGYLESPDGRLLTDTSAACTAVGRPTRGPYNENADVLSCFLKDDILKLSDTVGYSGIDPLFTQDIYDSPRLAIVPVLDHDPDGTKWMPIKTFVGAFITDQPTGASRQNPIVTNDTDNGLVIQNPKKLRAIRMFFFSINALPPPPDGTPLQDYFGTGPKVITLSN